MRGVVVSAVVGVVLLLVGLVGSIPERSAAQTASPAASPEPIGEGTPIPECSAPEIAIGEAVWVEPGQPTEHSEPKGVVGMYINPQESMAPQRLYLSVLTLPPHACIPYRYRAGAVVLYVQEGTVVYTAQADNDFPNPAVRTGDNDGLADDSSAVAMDTDVVLDAGHWVTQDRGVWYTFRNPGPGEAVVSIASYVFPPWEEGDPCQGGCRAP
jgi:hypothetical protein